MKAMRDPYQVLGVSPSATDEEIKQVYRNLAKKYHPDKYANSPLAESASEKMKEINEAYDRILDERKRAKSQGQSYSSYHNNRSRFEEIRQMINNGYFDAAEQKLSSVPSNERDAEWFYLMGVIVYRKGWLEEAYNYFQTACRMDPNNLEYRSIFSKVQQQRSGVQGGYNTTDTSQSYDGCCGPDCCEICACLMLSDCLCRGCR